MKNQIKYDLIGKVFGRWTVIESIPGYRDGKKKTPRKLKCLCSCGNIGTPSVNSIVHGRTMSCGCIGIEKFRERTISRCTSHGHATREGMTPEYRSWHHMKSRCLDKNDKNYNLYGGRGIAVCDSWANDYGQFFKDMGNRPSNKHSLDRINNNGNYEPENCKWSTQKEQVNNSRIIAKKHTIFCEACAAAVIVTPCHLETKKFCSRECQKVGYKLRRKQEPVRSSSMVQY